MSYVIDMKNALSHRLKSIAVSLSHPSVIFYLMPVLMILLAVGTIAQAEIGLYQAHQKYFASFVFWEGVIPFPGAYSLLTILTLNLLLKFLFFSEWEWKKSGIILSHFGALVLLIGGLLTALTAREGYMVIPEGNQSPFVYDYHNRDLQIYKDDYLYRTFSQKELIRSMYSGSNILPLNGEILSYCENCQILKREEHEQDFAKGLDLNGMAQFMALESKALEKEPEANLSGFSLTFGSSNEDIKDLYIVFEGMPKPIEIEAGGSNYKIIYGKQQRKLPFDIRLIDFEKENYPGMQMARGYSSHVVLVDGLSEWQSTIKMNSPLRYKGYTFYQSSFDQSNKQEITILSVVENKGKIFPYLGTFILGFGLLLHMFMRLRSKKGKVKS